MEDRSLNITKSYTMSNINNENNKTTKISKSSSSSFKTKVKKFRENFTLKKLVNDFKSSFLAGVLKVFCGHPLE